MGDQNTNKSSPTRVIIPTEKNVHNTNANPFIIPMARSKYQWPYQNTNGAFKIPMTPVQNTNGKFIIPTSSKVSDLSIQNTNRLVF